MATATEITVIVKDNDRTLREKILSYDDYVVSENDPIIKDCVARALKNFNGEPTDIKVRISLTIL